MAEGTLSPDAAQSSPDIPRAQATREEIISEIVQCGREFADPKHRYRWMCAALSKMTELPEAANRPISAVVEQTAGVIGDEEYRACFLGWVTQAAPHTAAVIAMGLQSAEQRERRISSAVFELAVKDPVEARRLIEEIRDPWRRARAQALLGKGDLLSYSETKSILREVAAAGRLPTEPEVPGQMSPLPWEFAALARFAVEDPEGVSRFVVEHLTHDDALLCLLCIASELQRQQRAPAAATAVLEMGISLAHAAEDGYREIPMLIRAGYGELRPREALRLYDEHVLPKELACGVRCDLGCLASVDMMAMLQRGERIAATRRLPVVPMIVGEIGRAAGDWPEHVVAWLADAPPGPLRSAVVASIASSLFERFDYQPAERLNQLMPPVWKAAQEIADARTRFGAYSAILWGARATRLPAPEEIVREFGQLWRTLRERLDLDEQLPVAYGLFALLAEEDQRQWIRRVMEQDATSSDRLHEAARLLHLATLPEEEKRGYYVQLLAEARRGGFGLSSLAHSISSLDVRWSLELAWEALPAIRREETGYIDWRPAENVREALQDVLSETSIFDCLRAEIRPREKLPDILWDWSRQVPQTDRDDVLQRLAQELLRRERVSEALGVARTVQDRGKRIVILSEIAAHLPAHGGT